MSIKKKDLPSMPFYYGDWRKAPEIRALDLDVRMIWFEMMGYMWESTERGYLTINGNPINNSVIARVIGVDITMMEQALKQLEQYNVFSRRESDSAIFSRKMVKDEELRIKKSLAGQKGMSVRYSDITPVITKPLTDSETEIENEIKDKKKSIVFKKWLEYRKALKKPIKVEATLDSLVKIFNTEPIEKIKWVVEQSIQNGYQGLFWDKYKEGSQSKPKKKINHYVYKCPNCNKEFHPRVMKGDDDFDAYRCDENGCQTVGLGKLGKNMVGVQLEFIKKIKKES